MDKFTWYITNNRKQNSLITYSKFILTPRSLRLVFLKPVMEIRVATLATCKCACLLACIIFHMAACVGVKALQPKMVIFAIFHVTKQKQLLNG